MSPDGTSANGSAHRPLPGKEARFSRSRAGRSRCRQLALVAALVFAAGSTAGWAADAPGSAALSGSGAGLDTLLARPTLTGDWNGLRPWLEARGITISLTQTSDLLGNPAGGIRQAAAYDGLFEPEVDIDLAKLIGWTGGSVHVAGYVIQGHGLSQDDIGNLLTVSSIEAPAGGKLGEFWFQQSLFDDMLAVKVGRILADQNFVISNTAALFVNSTFGFPGSFATDLPNGGPAYPNAAPGAQIILKPLPSWAFQAAIFEGDPSGASFDIDGSRDGGVFAIAEFAYAFSPSKGGGGLPGTYKVGAWYDSQAFDNLSVATNGVSLASPLSSGIPAPEGGSYAFYGVVDQLIWREPGTDDQGLSGFVRATVSPQADRNEINWYVDLGLSYTGLLPGRPSDVVGIGFAYANMSPDIADLARATNAYSNTTGPIPDYEAVIEITYQAAVAPWLSVQSFLQYIIHPGGNAPDPANSTGPIENATVVGLRMAVTL